MNFKVICHPVKWLHAETMGVKRCGCVDNQEIVNDCNESANLTLLLLILLNVWKIGSR